MWVSRGGKYQDWVLNHIRLDGSILWQEQDLGLGVCLVGELWALPCEAAPPAGKHKNQDWG